MKTIGVVAAIVAGLWWDITRNVKGPPKDAKLNDDDGAAVDDGQGGSIGIDVVSLDDDQPPASGVWEWRDGLNAGDTWHLGGPL